MNLKIIFSAGVVVSVVGCASNQPQPTITYIPGVLFIRTQATLSGYLF